ncbi:hypothetical protein MLD38_029668 [Melastoma candidum]|uniref:Uncharacterized protein n=1 Tax=Melastoma candidum TaxID=119954 RepID=A0ACB9N6T2_9MYRT|nr:hypothetical protein MLD38_029668 [Melastoma candidum]
MFDVLLEGILPEVEFRPSDHRLRHTVTCYWLKESYRASPYPTPQCLQLRVARAYRELEEAEEVAVRAGLELPLHEVNPGRGLSSVPGKCKKLEKIHLDMCLGIRDGDIINLSRTSSNLKHFSLRVPPDYSLPLLMNNPMRLTDESLKAVAQNCPLLEEVKISFCNGEFSSHYSHSTGS